MKRHIPGLFITGTDTGVGKTYVASLIARTLGTAGHRVGVYKPVASGCFKIDGRLVSEDATALWHAAGQPGDLDHVCPQRFSAPLAPYLAAHEEGRSVDNELLRRGLDYWRERSDVILVEGAGGLLSPLSDDLNCAELAAEFQFPLVIVSKNVLGVLNQTLQTVTVANTYHKGVPLAGVVLNDAVQDPTDLSRMTNWQELVARCTAKMLTQVKWGQSTILDCVDWLALAGQGPTPPP